MNGHNCETNVIFLKVNQDHHVFADVDEDSLSTQDMADIEDGKPLLFDEGRHKRHVCREQKEG